MLPVIVALVILILWSGSMGSTRSVATLKAVREKYGPYAVLYGLRYGVDPVVILAVICQETSGNPLAIGKDGERGLMQIMAATFQWINAKAGLGLSWDQMSAPAAGIQAGTAYLAECFSAFGGDRTKALQAYNGGIAGVKKNPTLASQYAASVNSIISTYNTL